MGFILKSSKIKDKKYTFINKLLNQSLVVNENIMVITGINGVGKTRFLESIKNNNVYVLDLEDSKQLPLQHFIKDFGDKVHFSNTSFSPEDVNKIFSKARRLYEYMQSKGLGKEHKINHFEFKHNNAVDSFYALQFGAFDVAHIGFK